MKRSLTAAFITMTTFYGYSQTYLPLTGGTLTGALTGTSATFSETITAPTFSGSLAGNASSATNWGFRPANLFVETNTPAAFLGIENEGTVKYVGQDKARAFLGLGTNAYSSIAYLPFTGGTLSGPLTGTSATFSETIAAPVFSGGLAGNASSATQWGFRSANLTVETTTPIAFLGLESEGTAKYIGQDKARSFLGLGSNAYSSTAYLALTGGGLTGELTGTSANFSGAIGIAAATTDPGSKLTVGGKVSAREVKVTIDAGADFVFEKDYNLKPLSEIGDYISTNKHLPEIASAKEMEKNGLELGQMNIKLLQKIEELTLYMIEKDKQVKDLQNRLEKIEKNKN